MPVARARVEASGRGVGAVLPPSRPRAYQLGGATGYGWRPGKSGNPKGRPPIVREVRELAQANAAAALRQLVKLMRTGQPDGVRLMAAVAILDRAYGRPPVRPPVALEQAVPEGAGLFSPEALKRLSDAQLARLSELEREMRAIAATVAGNGDAPA
jgi:hypothetical protein